MATHHGLYGYGCWLRVGFDMVIGDRPRLACIWLLAKQPWTIPEGVVVGFQPEGLGCADPHQHERKFWLHNLDNGLYALMKCKFNIDTYNYISNVFIHVKSKNRSKLAKS